jgi:hypothetical protein
MSYFLNPSQLIQNYGFEINGSTYDPIFTKSYVNSSPNVSILGTTCFIDYTNCFSTSDRSTLIKLFKSTPVGTTFALSNGDYFDEYVNVRKDISGVFSFSSLTGNDKLIVGSVVSGFTYDSTYSYYTANNFLNPPQYTTTYKGSTTSNWIVNNLNDGKFKSVVNKGILGSIFNKQEYVEISGSSLNSGKLLVNGSVQLKDKKELIYTGVTLTNENLSTTNTTITQFLRGNANPEILSKSRKTTGCYVVYTSTGDQVDCFENQNELQAFLRSQYQGSTYSTEWVVCSSCSNLSNTGINASKSDKSQLFDALVYTQITETTDASGNPSAALFVNYPTCYTLRQSSAISFTITNGFKIDLSHPSLQGYTITVYSENTKTNIVTNNLYYTGTPGYDQSSLIYVKESSSPRNLFVEFKGTVTLDLNVQIA